MIILTFSETTAQKLPVKKCIPLLPFFLGFNWSFIVQ